MPRDLGANIFTYMGVRETVCLAPISRSVNVFVKSSLKCPRDVWVKPCQKDLMRMVEACGRVRAFYDLTTKAELQFFGPKGIFVEVRAWHRVIECVAQSLESLRICSYHYNHFDTRSYFRPVRERLTAVRHLTLTRVISKECFPKDMATLKQWTDDLPCLETLTLTVEVEELNVQQLKFTREDALRVCSLGHLCELDLKFPSLRVDGPAFLNLLAHNLPQSVRNASVRWNYDSTGKDTRVYEAACREEVFNAFLQRFPRFTLAQKFDRIPDQSAHAYRNPLAPDLYFERQRLRSIGFECPDRFYAVDIREAQL